VLFGRALATLAVALTRLHAQEPATRRGDPVGWSPRSQPPLQQRTAGGRQLNAAANQLGLQPTTAPRKGPAMQGLAAGHAQKSTGRRDGVYSSAGGAGAGGSKLFGAFACACKRCAAALAAAAADARAAPSCCTRADTTGGSSGGGGYNPAAAAAGAAAVKRAGGGRPDDDFKPPSRLKLKPPPELPSAPREGRKTRQQLKT
jgi:hypothetical protein